MTRKDYRRLAAALASVKVSAVGGWENVACQWRADVLVIADALAADAPDAFDRERFYRACGMETK
jgi:hypothetical protein